MTDETNDVLQDSNLEEVNGGQKQPRRFPKGNNCYCPRCGALANGRTARAVQGMGNPLTYYCDNCGIMWLSSEDSREYMMLSDTVNENNFFEVVRPYQR